jgi:hypothetical protein
MAFRVCLTSFGLDKSYRIVIFFFVQFGTGLSCLGFFLYLRDRGEDASSSSSEISIGAGAGLLSATIPKSLDTSIPLPGIADTTHPSPSAPASSILALFLASE